MCTLFGFCLDRYPGFYVDDSFFSYAAFEAAKGLPFSYPPSAAAPYSGEIWSFHGPLLPNLYLLLFKLFGFSTFLVRLPDFIGGWLAATACVLFLHHERYRYAGLVFAILWVGDRSAMEIMLGRMEGIALLCLLFAFFLLRRAIRTRSREAAILCGLVAGFCPLVHPLCLYFTLATGAAVLFFLGLRGLMRFAIGGLLNVPILVALWHFKVTESWAQFRWHMGTHTTNGTGLSGFKTLMDHLGSSKFWLLGVIVIVLVSIAYSVVTLRRFGRDLPPRELDMVLASLYGAAGLYLLIKSSMFPYYLVYLTLWALLFFSTAVEVHWKQVRPLAYAVAICWSTSAFWNVMRLREALLLHSKLGTAPLYAMLHRDLPPGAHLATTPELYSVPLQAGYPNELTYWFPEHQEICPRCYLLVEADEYKTAKWVARDNLMRRNVIYSGPAFPGARDRQYPVVLLSPILR